MSLLARSLRYIDKMNQVEVLPKLPCELSRIVLSALGIKVKSLIKEVAQIIRIDDPLYRRSMTKKPM